MKTFYEFFAGGGMARAGLGSSWTCLLANDIDPKKGKAYRENWGRDELVVADIAKLGLDQMPGRPDLVWASFPCQDLSLAGLGAGLEGNRSGVFWAFWDRVLDLIKSGRKPPLIALENVMGLLTSNGGRDFAGIARALHHAGYVVGAVVMDASLFVPQSRKRVFIVAAAAEQTSFGVLTVAAPDDAWHPPSLRRAVACLDAQTSGSWRWWTMPQPSARSQTIADLLEPDPADITWHCPAHTQALLDMMTDRNREKLIRAQKGDGAVGTLYRRGRPGASGMEQRAEVRFDGIAGCLRTPAGGSSRQTVIIADRDGVRSRLLSSREAARLMGLPDDYGLPPAYNEAYHLMGDGVVVPAVDHLARHLLDGLLSGEEMKKAA